MPSCCLLCSGSPLTARGLLVLGHFCDRETLMHSRSIDVVALHTYIPGATSQGPPPPGFIHDPRRMQSVGCLLDGCAVTPVVAWLFQEGIIQTSGRIKLAANAGMLRLHRHFSGVTSTMLQLSGGTVSFGHYTISKVPALTLQNQSSLPLVTANSCVQAEGTSPSFQHRRQPFDWLTRCLLSGRGEYAHP